MKRFRCMYFKKLGGASLSSVIFLKNFQSLVSTTPVSSVQILFKSLGMEQNPYLPPMASGQKSNSESAQLR